MYLPSEDKKKKKRRTTGSTDAAVPNIFATPKHPKLDVFRKSRNAPQGSVVQAPGTLQEGGFQRTHTGGPATATADAESTAKTPEPYKSIGCHQYRGKRGRTQREQQVPLVQGKKFIVACKARRMAPDHNVETAYFELHDNMKHGEHLLCSYPQCASEGVKFCYCRFCRKPVAKQNFKSRHDHGDSEADPKHGVAEREQHESDGGSSSSSESSATSMGRKPSATERRPGRRTENEHKTRTTVGGTAKLSDHMKQRYWDQLLLIRPQLQKDEHISQWMDTVVLVSEPNVLEQEASRSFDRLLSRIDTGIKRVKLPKLSSSSSTNSSSSSSSDEDSPDSER